MIKEKLKEYSLFFISIIVTFIFFWLPLPYYVEKDGGLISTKDRIKIENAYSSSGEFYMAYVSELRVNIPIYLISLFNKNWDLIPKTETIAKNETEQEEKFRSKILLEESINNSKIAALNLTNHKVITENEKIYVIYIDELANTDLKIKDIIKKINGITINSKEELYEITNNLNIGDEVTIEVENDGKNYTRKATIFEYENKKIIGILISTIKDIKTDPNIDITFQKSESGSSGGLMMSLEIYNSLTEYDLTKGRKIAGTGTIDEDGTVGEISGIKYKLRGAVRDGADIFLAPSGENYEEAVKVAKENNLNIKIIEVSTLMDAINKLKEEN